MSSSPPDDFRASLPSAMVVPSFTGQEIGGKNSSFVVAEWTAPGAPLGPRQLIAPLHVHHADDEAWYVLEGMLAFQLGEQEVEAPAGTAVFAPRGTPHTYWNPRRTPARYLIIMTAAIRQLIDDLHALPHRDPAVLQQLFRQYHSELL